MGSGFTVAISRAWEFQPYVVEIVFKVVEEIVYFQEQKQTSDYVLIGS